MTATIASYQSDLPVGRDGFTQLVHAEWTKFRTVRGWVIGVVASALLIVGFAYLATFHHQNGGACVGTSAAATSCQTVAQPHVPVGPVNYADAPANGFYPLPPIAGFAVLCAYALLALGLASYLLRRRDA